MSKPNPKQSTPNYPIRRKAGIFLVIVGAVLFVLGAYGFISFLITLRPSMFLGWGLLGFPLLVIGGVLLVLSKMNVSKEIDEVGKGLSSLVDDAKGLEIPNLFESKGKAEKRLDQLEKLKKQQAISDEEYQKIRAKILSEL